MQRKKEPSRNTGCKGEEEGAFNEVDRKASEEVKAEQGGDLGILKWEWQSRLVERSEMRNKLKEREVKRKVNEMS